MVLFSRFRVGSVPQVPGTTLTCFSSAIRHVLLRVRRQGCTATISLTTRSAPNSLSGRWHQHRFSCRTILHPYVAPHRRTYTQQSSCERVHHRFIIVPPPSLFHTIPLSFVLSCVSPWCASVVRTNTYGFFCCISRPTLNFYLAAHSFYSTLLPSVVTFCRSSL